MKEQIIQIMKLAGYDFIEERPETRLLFYHVDQEQDVQIWLLSEPTKSDPYDIEENLQQVVDLIKNREYEHGRSIGRIEIQEGIRKLLSL